MMIEDLTSVFSTAIWLADTYPRLFSRNRAD